MVGYEFLLLFFSYIYMLCVIIRSVVRTRPGVGAALVRPMGGGAREESGQSGCFVVVVDGRGVHLDFSETR